MIKETIVELDFANPTARRWFIRFATEVAPKLGRPHESGAWVLPARRHLAYFHEVLAAAPGTIVQT